MKKSLLLVIVALLILQVHSVFNTDIRVVNDDKVKIDLYFESLCPGCRQFIQTSLKNASKATDFWKICDFNFFPYGNARKQQNGSSWSFTCQHGPR